MNLTKWHENIFNQFAYTIKNRYPVEQNSAAEASYDQIERMFGPQGHIEQWLNAYGDLIAQEGDVAMA